METLGKCKYLKNILETKISISMMVNASVSVGLAKWPPMAKWNSLHRTVPEHGSERSRCHRTPAESVWEITCLKMSSI